MSSSLTSPIEFWESVEIISVVIVILGVVGEYISDFVLRDAKKKEKIGKISTLVLVVGLVIELAAIWRIMGLTGRQTAALELRASSAKQEIARANERAKNAGKKAADANVAAGEANERAGKANERAAEAETKIAEARRQAAVAGVEAAKANERAALATQKAEELKAKSAILRNIMRPRRFFPSAGRPEEKAKYDALKRFAGTPVAIFVGTGNREARIFAVDIKNALHSAGWNSELRFVDPALEPALFEGVNVYPANSDEQPDPQVPAYSAAAAALVDLFNSVAVTTRTGSGFPIMQWATSFFRENPAFSRPDNAVVITVGGPPLEQGLWLLDQDDWPPKGLLKITPAKPPGK